MLSHPCHLCGKVEPLEEAIDAGWIPPYWDETRDAEVGSPVCVPCQAIHGIVYDDDFGYSKLPEAGTPTVVIV